MWARREHISVAPTTSTRPSASASNPPPPNGTFLRQYSSFDTINYYSFGFDSSYQAGMLTLRKRLARGFFYRFNYTYSKSIDDASQIFGSSNGGTANPQDITNLRLDRGRSDWDRGHVVSMNFTYQLPLGWQIAGSGTMSSGPPFTVKSGDNSAGGASRPDRLASGKLDNPSPDRWWDIGAFRAVANNDPRLGTAGRNILDAPGTISMNVALQKAFAVGERGSVRLRGEAFNVSNHANFGLPEISIASAAAATVNAVRGDGRTIQLGLRLQF